MRADYRLPRLFVEPALAEGHELSLDAKQANYLANVLRLGDGDPLLVFNGTDGEWRAAFLRAGRKDVRLVVGQRTRPQPAHPSLHVLFAPIRAGRLDYLVQKLVEMGAGTIRPVLTHHTQLSKVGEDRLAANIREAAEQCGVLAVPHLKPLQKLADCLAEWDPQRRLVFCDEDAGTNDPVPILTAMPEGPMALLVGPEGGFSDDERRLLRARPFVTAIPLGPRILRADTAAVAALAVLQATRGDWRAD